jgi:quinol monooxygenase YgiN
VYIIRASVPLKPEAREAGVEAARELARNCREHEDGTVDYRVAVDVDDETLLRFFELYEDKAAIAAHGEADHYLSFQERMPEFVAGDIEAVRYEVADATELR